MLETTKKNTHVYLYLLGVHCQFIKFRVFWARPFFVLKDEKDLSKGGEQILYLTSDGIHL